MTIEEISEKYKIPMEVLEEYESWRLCGSIKKVMGAWHYDDRDLEYLSLIMTLHEIGFTSEEVETYMRLLLKGVCTNNERLKILNQKRSQMLDEIHFKERQIDRLDYLRHKTKK